MNFNDVTQQLAIRKQALPPPVSPRDIQVAEAARTALGHPGWDLLQTRLSDLIAEQTLLYDALKTRIVEADALPHVIQWYIAGGREIRGRLTMLHTIRDYLPDLIKKVDPHANK